MPSSWGRVWRMRGGTSDWPQAMIDGDCYTREHFKADRSRVSALLGDQLSPWSWNIQLARIFDWLSSAFFVKKYLSVLIKFIQIFLIEMTLKLQLVVDQPQKNGCPPISPFRNKSRDIYSRMGNHKQSSKGSPLNFSNGGGKEYRGWEVTGSHPYRSIWFYFL